MSLNVLIDYYKQVKKSEATVVQLRDDATNNLKRVGILVKEIERKKNELSRLRQKGQALREKLRTEEERFKKNKDALDQWHIKPGDVEDLENRFRQLVLKTGTAAKEINELDDILKENKNRLMSTDPNIQSEFRQLSEITLKLKRKAEKKKRRSKRKKELQKRKKDLETKLEKTSAAIRQIKETYGREIEQYR